MADELDGTPACSDRLDLVDAAYTRPGGPEAQTLKRHHCPHCPVVEQCFTEGMIGEAGVWGGTSPKQRTKAGSPHFHKDRPR